MLLCVCVCVCMHMTCIQCVDDWEGTVMCVLFMSPW